MATLPTARRGVAQPCAVVAQQYGTSRSSTVHEHRAQGKVRILCASVRMCLASYAGISPADVSITRLVSGKPVLAPFADGLSLAFNVSHCQNEGLLAITSLPTIGVDLECVENVSRPDVVAAQALSAPELAGYREIAVADRAAHLLRIWTCKEAYLKATGKDFLDPCRNFR